MRLHVGNRNAPRSPAAVPPCGLVCGHGCWSQRLYSAGILLPPRPAHFTTARNQPQPCVKLDPLLKKILGFGLIACGALSVMSGVVNIIATYQLIDQAAAESLGISRNEFVATYACILLVGAALIFAGWRLKK